MSTKPNASQRIELLDILRGAAILGTLGTNIWLFAAAADIGALFNGIPGWDGWNTIIQQLTLLVTNGKFLGMLTILFGVGLEIQYQSARRRGTPFLPAYLWRSALLFLDGVLHFLLVIEWDILMGYAITAMLVALLVSRSDRVIRMVMWAAGGLYLLLVTAVTALLFTLDPRELNALGSSGAAQVYLQGSYWDQIAYRVGHALELRAEPIFVIPMGVCLFLFGAQLFRSGAFANDPKGAQMRQRMMRWGLGVGVPLNLLALIPELGLDLFARYVFAPIMAVGYIGLIAHALERGWLRGVSGALASVGRMALSNYMLQNILAAIVFYGWGFGLARHANAALTLLVWAGIAVTLVVFSKWWLRRFALGPFETVWKALAEAPFKRTR